jgi:hypothetical protein
MKKNPTSEQINIAVEIIRYSGAPELLVDALWTWNMTRIRRASRSVSTGAEAAALFRGFEPETLQQFEPETLAQMQPP